MKNLSINDSRTSVTNIFIDKSSSSAGGNSIYYTTKNTVLLLIVTILLVLLSLSSCNSGGLKPSQTKISGPLGEYFEVVDRDYKVNDSGVCNIEIKRIKAGFPAPWEEGMEIGYGDGDIEPSFTVEFMDEDGDVEYKDGTDIVADQEALEAIAALGVGESTTIPFSANIKKSSKFKVSSLFKAHEPSLDGIYSMKGTIGNLPVVAQFEIKGNTAGGTYYYSKYGPNHVLFIEGLFDKGKLSFEETDDEGNMTSQWDGSFDGYVYTGKFVNLNNGKEFNFTLKKTDESYKGRTERRWSVANSTDTGNHLAVINVSNIILPPEISDAVTIVPQSEGNVYCDFNHNYYPEVTLTFKLLRSVNTASLSSEYGQMWIAGHALDSEGREIEDLNPKGITSREWRTDDSDGKEFKEFLEGNVGGTITMHFTGENNIEDIFEKDQSVIEAGHNMVRNAAKNFKKFRLKINN